MVPRQVHERLLVKARGPRRRPPRSMLLFRKSGEQAVAADAATAAAPSATQGVGSGAPTTEQVDCPICCQENVALVDFGCGQHFSCRNCARAHATTQLTSGMLPVCMQPGCGVTLHPKIAQTVLAPRDFERYLLAALRESVCVRTCPKCSATVCVEGLGPGVQRSGAPGFGVGVRCSMCKHEFCAACEMDWHSGVTCEVAKAQQRQRNEAEAAREFAALVTELGLKLCPSCGSACEKSDAAACDHMTCAKCGHEFCWQCLADRAVVFAHGNHFHFSNCPFHFPFHGPAEYMPKKCKACKKNRRACSPPPQRDGSRHAIYL